MNKEIICAYKMSGLKKKSDSSPKHASVVFMQHHAKLMAMLLALSKWEMKMQ